MNSSSSRTEYKVMHGSSADTSTEAGRQLLHDIQGASANDGGSNVPGYADGRGFFDPSDRLYLIEQAQATRAIEMQQKKETDTALKQFFQGKIQQHIIPMEIAIPSVEILGRTKVKQATNLVKIQKKIKVHRKKQRLVRKKKIRLPALVEYASSSDSERKEE